MNKYTEFTEKEKAFPHIQRLKAELVGKVFERWLVLDIWGRVGKSKKIVATCVCTCGTVKKIDIWSLKAGKSTSCGCFRVENNQKRSGPNSPTWNGGVKITSQGYVVIYKPEHANRDKVGYVKEHIYVMSQIMGRPLDKDETVHHKNGIKTDNSPENLELWVSRHPPGQRVADLVIWAKQIISKYSHD
jgi:type IV secretory pathway protease TraF